jgi:hypothetical protein
MDMPRAGRPNTANTAENKERLQHVLTSSRHKSKSTRRLSTTPAVPRTTFQRMLKDMELKPQLQRLINKLNEDDPNRRLQFAE